MLVKIKDYRLIINRNEKLDMQEAIIVQNKNTLNFRNQTYCFEGEDILMSNNIETICFEKFPQHLRALIEKQIMRLIILEVDKEASVRNLNGDINLPVFDKNKRSDVWNNNPGMK